MERPDEQSKARPNAHSAADTPKQIGPSAQVATVRGQHLESTGRRDPLVGLSAAQRARPASEYDISICKARKEHGPLEYWYGNRAYFNPQIVCKQLGHSEYPIETPMPHAKCRDCGGIYCKICLDFGKYNGRRKGAAVSWDRHNQDSVNDAIANGAKRAVAGTGTPASKKRKL